METNDVSNMQIGNPAPINQSPVQNNNDAQLIDTKKNKGFLQGKFFITLIVIASVILIGAGVFILYKILTNQNSSLPFLKQKQVNVPTLIPTPTSSLAPVNIAEISPTINIPSPTLSVTTAPSATQSPTTIPSPTPTMPKQISATPTATIKPLSPTPTISILPNSGIPSVTIAIFSLGILLLSFAIILAGL